MSLVTYNYPRFTSLDDKGFSLHFWELAYLSIQANWKKINFCFSFTGCFSEAKLHSGHMAFYNT